MRFLLYQFLHKHLASFRSVVIFQRRYSILFMTMWQWNKRMIREFIFFTQVWLNLSNECFSWHSYKKKLSRLKQITRTTCNQNISHHYKTRNGPYLSKYWHWKVDEKELGIQECQISLVIFINCLSNAHVYEKKLKVRRTYFDLYSLWLGSLSLVENVHLV